MSEYSYELYLPDRNGIYKLMGVHHVTAYDLEEAKSKAHRHTGHIYGDCSVKNVKLAKAFENTDGDI